MTGKEYIELKREQTTVRRRLREIEQEACGFETGHRLVGYCEWADSGQECSLCHKRFKERCHYVGCKCSLLHTTDEQVKHD